MRNVLYTSYVLYVIPPIINTPSTLYLNVIAIYSKVLQNSTHEKVTYRYLP